jgi:hypothetical protein
MKSGGRGGEAEDEQEEDKEVFFKLKLRGF